LVSGGGLKTVEVKVWGREGNLSLLPELGDSHWHNSESLETQRCGKKFLGYKWKRINEAVALKKLLRCSRTTDPRQLGTYLYKVRCKLEQDTKRCTGEALAL